MSDPNAFTTCNSCGALMKMGAIHLCGKPDVPGAVNPIVAAMNAGPASVRLDQEDPAYKRLFAAIWEVNDTLMALGQRILAAESQVEAMRAEIGMFLSRQTFGVAPSKNPDDEFFSALKKWKES